MRDDPEALGTEGERASPEGQSRVELGSTNEYRAAAAWKAADHLVCPSCHHTIESGNLEGTSIHCEHCGGSFRLEKLAQASTIDAIRVIGRFQLLDAVGKGTFGTVWRARDTQLDRVVALKIPHPHAIESGLDAERLGREARIAAQLRHPGIVRLYEMLTLDDVPVLVSDFIEGLPLKELLKIRRLTFQETSLVVAQIGESLEYAHERGLIHRDIKPANIMIEYGAASGDPANTVLEKPGANRVGKPIVVDFGLALRPETEIVMTVEGQLLGTPAYMSPEQAAGHGQWRRNGSIMEHRDRTSAGPGHASSRRGGRRCVQPGRPPFDHRKLGSHGANLAYATSARVFTAAPGGLGSDSVGHGAHK